MIYSIVWDSSIFLGLAFIVMIGFGVGMPALFRKPSGTEDEIDDVKDAFGQINSSLETLFFALVGNFQPTVRCLYLHNNNEVRVMLVLGISICWKPVWVGDRDFHTLFVDADDFVA